MAHIDTRRRLIGRMGRPMTLRRPNPASGSPPADLRVQAYLYPFSPQLIAGPIKQGDAQVQMLNDEIAAAGWPGPPGAGDWLVIDGKTWQIEGANAVYDGSTALGFNLWVRGGQP
jgi:hypothetical protein